ncbi:MAG: alpha/beta hydrolase-fold protein [Cyclobacteriaceae bacterium]
MKLVLTVLVSVLLASFVTFLLVHLHFTGLLPWESDRDNGKIIGTLHSDILQETRDVEITLPRNYSTQKQYPVLYILDAGVLQDHSFKALDVLAENGYAPETIVVGIPNLSMETRQRDLTPPYMMTDIDGSASGTGSGDTFLNFLEEELIPFIDSHYSTSQYRLISGNSRGGLLVLHSLMTRPGLFQAGICYSTPFWRQDEIILQKFNEYLTVADSTQNFLFFSTGENETDRIRQGNNSLAERLKKRIPPGMVWNYQVTPKADHQSNAQQSVGRAMGLWGKHVQQQKVEPQKN